MHHSPGMGPPVLGPDGASPEIAASVRSFFVQKNTGRPGLTYEPVQKLGEGAFGVAHLVRDKRSGQLRVLKTINKRQSQVPPAQMEREIRNLKACDHPHIIRLFEYYEDYENVYLIMERAAGGELHQILYEQKGNGLRLPERWVSIVTRQCLMAISYVHSMGIIHKDLKSENIMLLNESNVMDPAAQPHTVIIDLGIAELFSARLGRRARCTVVAGTPTHMAPEVWRGNFGPVADVWSLGVVLFELLSGDLPFLCSSLNSAAEWVRMHCAGPNWLLLTHTSTQARALNQRMLSSDERMRPTAQQCLGHSWFKDDAGGIVGAGDAGPSAGAVNSTEVSQSSPLSPRSADSLAERLRGTLHAYQGRSKFEKSVLLQVASNIHIAQVGHIGDVFCAADLNRNGFLDKAELVGALRRLGAEQSDAEGYAECLDVDASGQVEYTEFAAGCLGLLLESLRGLLWQSFCVLDTDGNGVLCRAEVQAVVTNSELTKYGFPGGGDKSSVEEVLNRMDVDSNGKICFDELCKQILPRTTLAGPVGDSPRAARSASMGKGAGADGLGYSGGAGSPSTGQDLPGKKRPTLRDEDFAQLLDEIEADQDALANRSTSEMARSGLGSRGEALDVEVEGITFPSSVIDHIASEPASTKIPTPTRETFREVPLSLADDADDPATALLFGDPSLAADTPAPGTPSAADVDQELSRMLDDIANSP